MRVYLGKTVLELVEGDISEQETEAIVTATHWELRGGQGTDGAVHFKAGPKLLEACREIGGCPIGGAVITDGFDLKAHYVIHAVGPAYEDGSEQETELLACAYLSSLQIAAENGIRSIAFPAISTGSFGFPMEIAAPIALWAIIDFLRTEPHELELVRVVLFPYEHPDAYAIFAQTLEGIASELGVYQTQ